MLRTCKIRFLTVAAALCCIGLFTTCKNTVGLGGTVDITPPEIKSVYPPIGAVIRGPFILAVEAKDDTKIEQVSALIKSKNTDFKYAENFILSADGAYWQRTLNTKDEQGTFRTEKFMYDGTYSVAITVHDASGKETTVESSFTVDNTAPLLVLTRPSTAALNPDVSYTGADTFGDKFMLVGQVYDKSDVAKLRITAENMDGRTKAEGELDNVPQNIRLTKDFLSFSTDVQQQFYKKLYGSDRNASKKQFRYKIRVWDSAKEYTTPDKPSVSTNDVGNSTDIYYISTDLYDKVLSKYKIQTVYAMLNGTYQSSSDKERSAADIEADAQKIKEVRAVMQDAKIQLGGSGERTGTFALYPSLNPRFDVPGVQPIVKSADSVPNFPQMYDDALLRVKLSQNLDEDPLYAFPGGGGAEPDPYRFYLMDWEVYKTKGSDQSYDINMQDAANDPDLIELKRTRVEPEGGNYLVTLPIKKTEKLHYGHRYVLLVKGTDRKEHTIIADQKESGGTLYGIRLVKNEQKPEVTVVNINGKTDAENITEQVFIKKNDPIVFTVKSERAALITYTLKDGTSVLFQGTKTIAELDSVGGTVTIPTADTHFSAAGGSYKLVVQADNPDTGLSSIEQTYHLLYDVAGPKVTIEEPAGGVIEGSNGHNVTIRGTAIDTGIGLKASDPVTVTLMKDGNPCDVIFVKNGENWELQSIDLSDTTKYGQGEYTLTVSAEDGLGQKTDPVETQTFIYDDKAPEITDVTVSDEDGSNSVAVDLSRGITVYRKTDKIKINGKVTESYGLKTFTIQGDDVGIATSEINPSVPFSKPFTLPVGSHPIAIELIDKAGRLPQALPNPAFTVLVDQTAPQLSMLKIAGYDRTSVFESPVTQTVVSSATPVPVDGTISDDGSGVARVQYKIHGESDWNDLIVSGTGAISGSIPIANNSIKTVTLRATDFAGNVKEWKADIKVSSETVEIQLDVLGTNNPSDTDTMKYRNAACKVKIGASLSILAAGDVIPVSVEVFKDGSSTALPNTDFFTTDPNNIIVKKLSAPTECEIKTPLPADGEYKIKVSAAGSSKTVIVMIDTAPPVLTPRVPAEGQALREAQKLFAAISDIPGIGIESVTAVLKKSPGPDQPIAVSRTGSSVESTGVLDLVEGENTIEFTCKDKLGNEKIYTVHCTFDQTPPVLSNITINGKSSEKVWIGVDSSNKIKTVKIKGKVKDTNKMKAIRITVRQSGTSWGNSFRTLSYNDDAEHTWEQQIEDSQLNGSGRYTVSIIAEDAAGLTTAASCSFEIDSDAPKVSFTAPAAGVKVNKTVTISGKASDEQELKSVKIVKVVGSTESELAGVSASSGYDSGDTETADTKALFKGTKAYNWHFTLDTNNLAYPDNTDLKLKAIATDAVGNTKEEPFTVTIDQNSDRPVVTVTSFSKIEESKANLVGTRTLTGKVEDDDGPINASNIKIRVSPKASPSGSFEPVTVSNGVWTYTIPSDKPDGAYQLDFELTDAAGTDFKTLATTSLARPYVMGYEDMLSSAKDQNIAFKLDTVQPEFKTGGAAFVLGSAFSGSGTAITPHAVVGNGSQRHASFRAFVYDASGIKGVKLTLNNGAAVSGTHTSASDAGKYEAWDFTNVQLVEGTVPLAITATDNANFEKTWQETIISDFTPPTVSVEASGLATVYYRNADIIGQVAESGSGVSGIDVATIEYKIGNAGWFSEKHVASDSTELSKFERSAASWKVSIADVAKYKDGYGAVPPSGANNKIHTIDLQIKVKDKAGNEKLSDVYQVKFDPTGSTPILELITPDANATLGTSVSVSGLARTARPEASQPVKKIELQLSQTNAFGATWMLNGHDYGNGFVILTSTSSTGYNYWQKTLEQAVITNILGSAAKKDVWLRVRGISADGSIGDWTEGRKCTISKDVAEFSSIHLAVSSTDPSPEPYVPNGTWIKGDTYVIKGSVTHSTGIKTIEAKTENASSSVQSLDTSNSSGWFTARTDGTGYDFAISVKTSHYAQKSGSIEFDIIAEDNRTGGQSIKVRTQVRLKYDNSVPVVAIGTPVIKGDNTHFASGTFTPQTALDPAKKDLYRVIANNKTYTVNAITGTTATLSPSDLTGDFDYAIAEQPKILQDSSCQIEGIGEDSGSHIQKVKIELTVNGQSQSVMLNASDSSRPIESLRNDLSSFKGSLDTTQVPNGEGTLKVTAYDGANNEISDQITTIQVKNNPLTVSKLTFRTDLDGNGTYDTAFGSDETHVASLTGSGNGLNADQDFRGAVNVAAAFTYKDNTKSELEVELMGGYNSKRYLVLYKDSVADSNLIKAIGIKPTETSGTAVTGNTQTFDLKDLLDNIGDGESRKLILRAYDESVGGLWYAETDITVKVAHADSQNPSGVIAPFFYNADKTKLESDADFKLTSVKYDAAKKEPLGHIEIEPISVLGTTHQYPCVSGTVILRGIAYDNVRIKELKLSGAGINVSNTTTNGNWNTSSALKVVKNSYSRTGHYVEWEYEWATGTPAFNQTVTLTVKDSSNLTNSGGNDPDTKTGTRDSSDNRALTLASGQKAEKYQFLRFFEGEKSYLVQISDVDASGTKVKWTNVDVPIAMKEYKLYDHTSNIANLTVNVVPYISRITTELSKLGGNDPDLYARTALGRYSVRDGETIELHGFNLAGAAYTVGGVTVPSANVTGTASQWTLTLPPLSTTNSGAKSGKLEATVGTPAIAAINNKNNNDKLYNKGSKTANNDKLTDDVELDVWLFNSEAVKSQDSSVTYPMMKIHPDAESNGRIGFAFANGTSWFSMASSTTSYTIFQKNWDLYQNVGFAYGPDGTSYGIASGTDVNTSNNPDTCSLVTFFKGNPSGSYNDTGANYAGSGGIAFESIGLGDGKINKNRIQSPAIAVGKAVYIAYYDLLTKQLRFRTEDQIKPIEGTLGQPKDSKPENYHKVVSGNTPFVTLGVVSAFDTAGTATSDTAVVLAYYDASARKLKLKYNTTPGTLSGWTDNTNVDFSGGQDVQLAVDRKGGIHMAYTTSSGDLAYAYSTSYNGAFTEYIVDSYSLTGSRLTIDIANDTNGKPIPYIGYFMQGASVPKLAYLKDGAVLDVGAENDYYTGKWEVSVVPTPKGYDTYAAGNKVNVGVWKKKTDGKLTNSKKVTSASTISSGNIYGNGTSNPVLGYVIGEGTIETAQKK